MRSKFSGPGSRSDAHCNRRAGILTSVRPAVAYTGRIIKGDTSADLPPLFRANVAGSAWTFEATDGFRKHLLRQPEHDLRKKDHERDRNQEDAIDRQRRAQRLRESDPHKL